MSLSEASFGRRAEQIAQQAARKRMLENAHQQRKTIVGTEDGHWLMSVLKNMRTKSGSIRLQEPRRFHFLSDSAEAVLNQRGDESTYESIEMPTGSTIRKLEGNSYDTSVFRIDNGRSGTSYEHIDLAYRKVGRDRLLYLKARRNGERTSSGRRAGSRIWGHGPDRSL